MKALVFNRHLQEIEMPLPQPRSGEALIRIRLAGICNTDLEIMKGYMAFQGILGHEFVGEVVSAEEQYWLNKRVAGEINMGCGECSYCLNGLSRHCQNRQVLGIQAYPGVFAEYCRLPVSNLHVVPESVPDEEAVWIEPLAAACEILEQFTVHSHMKVAVIGDGKLGQVCARVLSQTGCRMTVYGKHPGKLKLLEPFNIRTELVKKSTESDFDVVIEASGNPEGLQAAMMRVKPRGTLILKSTTHHTVIPNLNPLVIHELQLIGSRCGPFEPAIQLLEKKRISVQELNTKTFPFADWKRAFEEAEKKESLKICLDMR